MPAHVSHLLFAEEAVRRVGADGERLLDAADNLTLITYQVLGPGTAVWFSLPGAAPRTSR